MKATTLPARTRTWQFQPPTWTGLGPVTETCTEFCRNDHSSDQGAHPSDVWHQAFETGLVLQLSETEAVFEEWRVLEAQLTTRPHAPDPAVQVPHVAVEFVEGVWTPTMDAETFGDFIDRLAAHVGRLRVMHSQLVQAVAEHQAGGQ